MRSYMRLMRVQQHFVKAVYTWIRGEVILRIVCSWASLEDADMGKKKVMGGEKE